ncbi:hypothetical protein Tco_0414458 [Tanacetum coccineum]
MMSAVAGIGQIRFRDTCAEAKRFFNYEKGGEQSKIRDITFGERTRGMDLKHINACKDILINVSIEVPPVTVKGDKSKSFVVLCSQEVLPYSALRVVELYNDCGRSPSFDAVANSGRQFLEEIGVGVASQLSKNQATIAQVFEETSENRSWSYMICALSAKK